MLLKCANFLKHFFLCLPHSGLVAAGVFGGVFGGILGSIVTTKRMKSYSDREKKDLIQYIQLQDELYKYRDQQWQTEYQKLFNAYEDLEKEIVERDYEEFKAPDSNNNERISKEEFETYVSRYLASFPDLSSQDFPKFEEFDVDENGEISFEEWQKFITKQKETTKNEQKNIQVSESSDVDKSTSLSNTKQSMKTGKDTPRSANSKDTERSKSSLGKPKKDLK